MDCHSLHSGDPRGQITEQNRGNTPCLRCHERLGDDSSLEQHTRHQAESPGSLCYSCHMPQIAYGVMTIHRSHRIEAPDARRDATTGRPNACLNCHQAQTTAWVLEQLDATASPSPLQRADGMRAELSDLAITLAGDPVQKAVAAWRAGQRDAAQRGRSRAWMTPYLLAAMNDIYPSSRRFASQSLARILEDWPQPAEVADVVTELDAFDFIGSATVRKRQLAAIEQAWLSIDKSSWPPPPAASGVESDYRLPQSLMEELIELGRRADKQIAIGE
jgi:nitrate/TMAO reductase-like tetraheme cytochrome c subunit